jgi:hypothetical protein
MAGIYETYDGEIVTLLDERNGDCRDNDHLEGHRLADVPPSPSGEAPAEHDRQRRS